MERKEIILKITNEKVFFNGQLCIPITQTNIPKQHLTFRRQDDIFWMVEMIDYKSNEGYLTVKVIDYNASDISKFETQRQKNKVTQLVFEKFEWEKLEKHLSSYKISELQTYIIQNETISHLESKLSLSYPSNLLKPSPENIHKEGETILPGEKNFVPGIIPSLSPSSVEQKPVIKTIKKEFLISFTDVYFKLGYVTFKKYINEIKQSLDFKIANENILAEFENIKFWFAKKLKSKRIRVIAMITLIDAKVSEVIANSIHIDLITPDLIDSIKYQRTLAITKEPRISTVDKSLFTADEIFNQFDNDIEGNIFKQTEEGIFNLLIEKTGVRNKKQLAYLSGKKQSDKYGLRYTLHPHFGFLFLVEGVENNHFIWELLKSHATYIWSIHKSDKEIELQFKRIEAIINIIRSSGREAYKKAFRNDHLDNDLVFRIIEHEEIGSDFVDGFPKWKNKLNEQLT